MQRLVVRAEVERAMQVETYSWTSARWVIIAPLGFDVVPEV